MSYDIYLNSAKCAHCGRGGDNGRLGNPTYNLTPIFDLALTGERLPNPDVAEGAVVLLGAKTDRPRGLRVLSGLTGAASLPMIKVALGRLRDPVMRAQFEALEPENKWGDLSGAHEVMEMLAEAAADAPDSIWEIH